MGLNLTLLKSLIQNMTRCTKTIQKLIFFQKVFFWKNNFSRTTFPRMHKKANFDVFTVYIDQLNCSLSAGFPKNLDFLKTVFSSKFNAWLKSWTKSWCYVGIQFTFWHEVFYFFKKASGVAKKFLTFLFKIGRVLKRCFKIWHVVKIPIPEMTSCLKLTENLTYLEILDSKSDAL